MTYVSPVVIIYVGCVLYILEITLLCSLTFWTKCIEKKTLSLCVCRRKWMTLVNFDDFVVTVMSLFYYYHQKWRSSMFKHYTVKGKDYKQCCKLLLRLLLLVNVATSCNWSESPNYSNVDRDHLFCFGLNFDLVRKTFIPEKSEGRALLTEF